MQSAQTQILALLDYGRITVTEAETLLVATKHSAISARSKRRAWLTSFWLVLALLAGVSLRPELNFVSEHVVSWLGPVIDGLPGPHLIFNRLMEAYL
jgi:hypothetical protein